MILNIFVYILYFLCAITEINYYFCGDDLLNSIY